MATRMVNGVQVELSAEELSEIQALQEAMSAPKVPDAVTMAQARKVLVLQGITMDQVSQAIAAIPDATERELAQIDWEYSTQVNRESPLVASISAALGLTSQEVDQLFIQAVTL